MQLPVQLIVLSLSLRTMQLQLTTPYTSTSAAYQYFHFHACLKALDSLHSHHVENFRPYLQFSCHFLIYWSGQQLDVTTYNENPDCNENMAVNAIITHEKS
jgi:hypothetical protein